MHPAVEHIAEAVGSNHCTRMNAYPIAHFDPGIEYRIGEQVHVFSKLAAGADMVTSSQNASRTNLDFFPDHAVRSNMRATIQLGGIMHNCRRVDARRKGRFRKK